MAGISGGIMKKLAQVEQRVIQLELELKELKKCPKDDSQRKKKG